MPGKPLVVIALGGNAFLPKGAVAFPHEQWRRVRIAAKTIVDVYSSGYNVAVTHGNGPQVGIILEWMEGLRHRIPPQTLDIANAMTQGWLGYMLQQAIGNAMEERGLGRRVATIVTQVVVSSGDPAFKHPTKFVGPYYSREEAEKLSKNRGWVFAEDPRGGWRRVVPSPRPHRVVELDVIRDLLEKGYITICVGGGGIPVTEADHGLEGVEAVIDKDLASAVLAIGLGADRFVILTDVEGVYIDYGKPGQRLLREMRVGEARRLLEEGQFPPGSMGPKVEAAIMFVEKTERLAIIGRLEDGVDVVRGVKGTIIKP